MGILSKLPFFKKKDDFGLGKEDFGKDLGLDKDLGLGETGMNPDLGMGMESKPDPYSGAGQNTPPPQQPAPSPQGFQPAYPQPAQPTAQDQDYVNSKTLEVISSKLDALRASLDAINQRLANIENIAQGEQEEHHRRRYY